jgi:carbonic anhydrase/acetyltransferase-like protein (isoleucine patch superfamily)
VTEGKEFPDNSLIVGSPAKVMRTLDEAEQARRAADRRRTTWRTRALCAPGLKKIG